MIRAFLLLFLFLLFAIAVVVFLIKKIPGGSEQKTLQEETADIIQKTAKGMDWLQEQWQAARNNAESEKPETGSRESMKTGTIIRCSYCEEEYEISPLSPDSVRRGVCPQCNNSLL